MTDETTSPAGDANPLEHVWEIGKYKGQRIGETLDDAKYMKWAAGRWKTSHPEQTAALNASLEALDPTPPAPAAATDGEVPRDAEGL